MNFTIQKIIAIVVFLMLYCCVNAQTPSLRGKKVLQMPVNYVNPSGNILTKNAKKLTASGPKNDWIVYSDRANNPTYQTPSGIKYKTMAFMESFYVIDEKENHVHLIKCDPEVVLGNSRKVDERKAVDYGWVNKDKLLLWRSTLINKQTGFSIKVLTVRNIAAIENGLMAGKEQFRFFDAPDMETDIENEIEFFEFLFVYKKEKGKYLIGSSKTLPPFTEKVQKTMGWVSENYIQIWSDRLCIEPNYEEKAADERRKLEIQSSALKTYEAALTFKSKAVKREDIIWNKDNYEERFPAEWRRFPVLSKLENDVYEVGIITNVFDGSNFRLLPIKQYSKLERDYNTHHKDGEKVYELYTEAYVPMKIDQLSYPLFKQILLLTDNELHNMEQNLQKLIGSSAGGNQRKIIIDGCKAMLKRHYGKHKQKDGDINDKTLGELLESVSGLPITGELLKQYSMNDIRNKQKVTDEEIKNIFLYIGNKLDSMKKIVGNSTYFFRSRNETYYWIPIDELP